MTPHKIRKVSATRGLTVLTWIVILAIYRTRDLPDQEKRSTITGLPKLEGQVLVNSTDTIRPIYSSGTSYRQGDKQSHGRQTG